MRIPNKFNGYGRDGIRLYNDPATATITLASMGEGAAIASSLGSAGLLGTVGTSMVGAGALAEGMALGSGLYNAGTGIASLLPSQAAAAAPVSAASNFVAPNYMAQIGNAGVAPVAEVASPFSETGIQSVLQSAQPAPISPVEVMQVPVNAAPEVSNITNSFPAQFQGDVNSLAQSPVMQQRINNLPVIQSPVAAPVESIIAPPPSTAVVEAPVESPLLNPSNATPTDFKLATNGATQNVVTEGGGKAVTKSGMTGGAWDDFKTLAAKPNWQSMKDFANEHPYLTGAAGLMAYNALKPSPVKAKEEAQYIRPYRSTRAINPNVAAYQPYSNASTAERNWFTGGLEALPIYRAAKGGLTSLAVGGPVETMSAMNSAGENLQYPQADIQTAMYSNPMVQRPVAYNLIKSGLDTKVDPYTGEEKFADGGSTGEAGGYKYSYDPTTMQFTQLSDPMYEASQQPAQTFNSIGQRFQQQINPAVAPKPYAPVTTGGISQLAAQPSQTTAPVQQPAPQVSNVPAYQTPEQQLGLTGFYDYMNQQLAGMRGQQGMAAGGLSNLGGYSDGGRLLKGPGDGVSDSIPASIGDRQPARLADGEFVVPARIVSEIGNGSTEAGARKLYAMMDRVQKARKKSTGKDSVAVNSKAEKYLPA
jgi:hypothetical protein